MRLHKKLCTLPLLAFGLILFGCSSSKTAKTLEGFADKVCACKDAACAKAAQEEILTWRKNHQRARGSEEAHKEVEASIERFAKCYTDLVGVEKSDIVPVVPKVDLSPPKAVPVPQIAPSPIHPEVPNVVPTTGKPVLDSSKPAPKTE